MAFQPGQSGNPSGRPKGVNDKRSEYRSLLEPHAKELTEKLIEMAKNGEPTALRLCIERLIPRVKPDIGINFTLPEGGIDTSDNMLQIINDLTNAVASGQMTIEEANKFTEFLRQQRIMIGLAMNKKDEEEWKKTMRF